VFIGIQRSFSSIPAFSMSSENLKQVISKKKKESAAGGYGATVVVAVEPGTSSTGWGLPFAA